MGEFLDVMLSGWRCWIGVMVSVNSVVLVNSLGIVWINCLLGLMVLLLLGLRAWGWFYAAWLLFGVCWGLWVCSLGCFVYLLLVLICGFTCYILLLGLVGLLFGGFRFMV